MTDHVVNGQAQVLNGGAQRDGSRKPYDLALQEHDFPYREGPPQRSILICTHPRSGSTLLGEALYAAGDLGCPLEYFHRGFRPGLERRWNVQGIDALTQAAHSRRTTASGILSAKLFWQDIEVIAHELDPGRYAPPPWTSAEITSPQAYRDLRISIGHIFPNPTWVYLLRRDRVRQAVSALVATQSGVWRMIPGVGDASCAAEPVYDRERIAALVALANYTSDRWTKFFDAITACPYVVTYEDLDRDYETTVTDLLRHLDRPVKAPPRRMRRQSDARSEALVLRFLRDSQTPFNQASG